MPRPANLILDDALVTITIGALAKGQAPTFTGTATSVMGILRSGSIETGVEKTEVRGAGDNNKRHRYHGHGATMECESFVPSVGYSFADSLGTFEGCYIRIQTKEISSMTSPRQWVGVIERWRWEGSKGEGQVERITIDLNPDYDVA